LIANASGNEGAAISSESPEGPIAFLRPRKSSPTQRIKMTGIASFDLCGSRALVTGAAGLLGQEHAVALAEIGAEVILTDIAEPGLIAAQSTLAPLFGDRIRTAIMDVTCEQSILQLAESLGPVDVLVNNAAIDPKVGKGGGPELSRLENFSLEEWNRQISVGLSGAFLCSKIFGARMAERRNGVILNLASDLSVIAPDQRLYYRPDVEEHEQPVKPVTYSVIKTGMLGLTRYLAAYWAEKGVRVNAISPGGVFNNHPDEFVKRLSQLIPMGRMADPSEYRAAVQFLCSPASSYLTGQNIVIDGGRSIL
jgi:NAD(P)-dependent dehydrogenase (short-subunit alcohol dehydrogenase family)